MEKDELAELNEIVTIYLDYAAKASVVKIIVNIAKGGMDKSIPLFIK